MEEKDREIWIEKSRFYLGEDNIFYVTVNGDADETFANAAVEITFKLIKTVEGKVNMLIDLNKAGKPSKAARERGRETFEDEKVGRVALVGLHPVAKVIASFMMGVSKRKNLRFFKTKDEALAWLKVPKGDK